MAETKIGKPSQEKNPRIKSLRMSAARLSLRISSAAETETDIGALTKLAIAQSAVSTALLLLEHDTQRAGMILDNTKSLVASKKE